MLHSVSGLQLGSLPFASTIAGVSLLTTSVDRYVFALACQCQACAMHAFHYAVTQTLKLEPAVHLLHMKMGALVHVAECF